MPMLEAYGMTEASHQMASNPLPPRRAQAGLGRACRPAPRSGSSTRPATRSRRGRAGRGRDPGAGRHRRLPRQPARRTPSSFFDGWFRTGDRGVLDDDGYLRLEGRLKEMILRGGENISPYEIEEVLLAHPAVADAVCFGVDDEKYGELVGAAVALREPTSSERELIGHCRERLAAFKVPDVDPRPRRIPRTATGKVQRKRVGESLSAAVTVGTVRFAVLGAGAIGAYVGRRARRAAART